MHVIRLAVELDELATPILAALRDDLPQAVKHRAGDAFAPVFGDKNQVVMERINTVKKRAHVDSLGHRKLSGTHGEQSQPARNIQAVPIQGEVGGA